MLVHQSIADFRQWRHSLTGRVALVPTMGALHAGHLSLMKLAREWGEHVVATIFVNPTQFAPHEDFSQYPRPIDTDLAACEQVGVDVVLTPSLEEMYPPDASDVAINVPAIAELLEGVHRPQFFPGVCRVVLKLLNIVQPDAAIFGRKDYQQWLVVDNMVRDLLLPTVIIPGPTVREADGLAMSSRNVYLSPEERKHALGLSKALSEARMMIEESGESNPAAVERAMKQTLLAHHVVIDYAVVRHPRTLQPMDIIDPAMTQGVVALVAGTVGRTRLIDNVVMAGA